MAAVRQSAIQVHTIIVKTLLEDNSAAPAAYGLIRVLLADLVDELVRSVLWSHRQTYAFLALKLFDEQALDHAQYAQDVLPSLLDLSYDKVPNVRLAVARVLNQIRQMSKCTTPGPLLVRPYFFWIMHPNSTYLGALSKRDRGALTVDQVYR